jgi:hypothetical protein
MDDNYQDPRIVRHYRRLVEAIQRSTQVVLYKGCSSLDHPHPEEPVISFDSYRFYKAPLPLKPEDAVKLTELCCNPENFILEGGVSLCLFHEDYCVEWRSDEQTTQLVFCFTCAEVYGRYKVGRVSMPLSSPEVFQALLPSTPWEGNDGWEVDGAEIDWTEFYEAEDENPEALIARYKELQRSGD